MLPEIEGCGEAYERAEELVLSENEVEEGAGEVEDELDFECPEQAHDVRLVDEYGAHGDV